MILHIKKHLLSRYTYLGTNVKTQELVEFLLSIEYTTSQFAAGFSGRPSN